MRNAKGQFVSQNKITRGECLVCNKEFYYPSSYHSKRKYCSLRCYHQTLKGKKRPEHSRMMRGRPFKKRQPLTKEHRKKLSGKNHPRWKGGITPLRHKIKRLAEYDKWRFTVYKRDLFTCQHCKKYGIRLECHHIKSLASIIRDFKIKNIKDALKCKVLWDIKNGLTLCRECHKLTETYGKNNH